jgi:hypothetical protein
MSGPKVVQDANGLYGNLSSDILLLLFAQCFYQAAIAICSDTCDGGL